MGISSQLAAARLIQPGVCTSSTRPASPFEGQVIYETDTNQTLTYSGSAWVMVNDLDSPPGIVLIKEQAFTNQATQDVSDVFSSTFDWYRIEYAVNSTSTSSGRILTMQMLTGSTPATANYSSGMRSFNTGLGTATWEVGGNATTLFYCGYAGEPNYAPASGFFDLFWPNAARHTTQTGQAMGLSSSVAYYHMTFGGVLVDTTQYTGMRFAATANNITGTIRVYGYRNSI